MKHIYPLSDMKHLILLQFCNVNTQKNKNKIQPVPQFCFVSEEKYEEYLPETANSLRKPSVKPDKSFTFCSETSAQLQLVSVISKIMILTAIPFSELELRSYGLMNKSLLKHRQTLMDLGLKKKKTKKKSNSKAILKYNTVIGIGCICSNISLSITFTSRNTSEL